MIEALAFADRYTADVGRGTHGDFCDDVAIEAALSLVRPGEPRTTAEGVAAYREAIAAVRQFLDGVLRVEPKLLDALAAAPGGVLRMKRAPGAAIPTSEEWVALLARDNLDDLVKRAERLAANYPTLPVVVERDLNRAGYRLLSEGKAQEAVRMLRFNALTHPSSANVYDSLADACKAAVDRDGMISAYRKLLQALPNDSSLPAAVKERMRINAEGRLVELGVSRNR